MLCYQNHPDLSQMYVCKTLEELCLVISLLSTPPLTSVPPPNPPSPNPKTFHGCKVFRKDSKTIYRQIAVPDTVLLSVRESGTTSILH